MEYIPKKFNSILGFEGLSDELLTNHFSLYEAYVANTNKLITEMGLLRAEGKEATPQGAEMRRRFGWEWNGMRLHELYFSNMTKEVSRLAKNTSLYKSVKKQFGSWESWEKDFRATGSIRGIGWACLVHDPQKKIMFNTWINEHDGGHLAGGNIVLIMDVFEHAFVLDYGMKRLEYIDAFMKGINWSEVESRFRVA